MLLPALVYGSILYYCLNVSKMWHFCGSLFVHKLHIIWVTFRNVLYVDNKCVLFIVWCKFCANIIILIIYYGHRQQCQLDEIRLPAPECIRAYHNRLLPVLPLFFSCSIFERLNQVWKFIRLWLITTTISSYRRFAL